MEKTNQTVKKEEGWKTALYLRLSKEDAKVKLRIKNFQGSMLA